MSTRRLSLSRACPVRGPRSAPGSLARAEALDYLDYGGTHSFHRALRLALSALIDRNFGSPCRERCHWLSLAHSPLRIQPGHTTAPADTGSGVCDAPPSRETT